MTAQDQWTHERPEDVPHDELLPLAENPRRLRCLWKDRFRLGNALLGRVAHVETAHYFKSAVPVAHPRNPDLFVVSLTIVPEGKFDGSAFPHAVITVHYGPLAAIPSADCS